MFLFKEKIKAALILMRLFKTGELMYKAVVFDLDHTLFDRYETLSRIIDSGIAYTIFSSETDKQTIKNEWIYADKHFCPHGWDGVYDYLKNKGLLRESLEKKGFFKNHIEPLYMQIAVPFPFTIPTLNALKQRGYKLGLITNGDHPLQMKKLEMLGLQSIFDEVIISHDFGTDKPDRFLFDKMAELLGCENAEMVYIGDHPLNDVDASRRAGYTPVWVRTSGVWSHPDIEKCELQVDNVSELLKFL